MGFAALTRASQPMLERVQEPRLVCDQISSDTCSRCYHYNEELPQLYRLKLAV